MRDCCVIERTCVCVCVCVCYVNTFFVVRLLSIIINERKIKREKGENG